MLKKLFFVFFHKQKSFSLSRANAWRLVQTTVGYGSPQLYDYQDILWLTFFYSLSSYGDMVGYPFSYDYPSLSLIIFRSLTFSPLFHMFLSLENYCRLRQPKPKIHEQTIDVGISIWTETNDHSLITNLFAFRLTTFLLLKVPFLSIHLWFCLVCSAKFHRIRFF